MARAYGYYVKDGKVESMTEAEYAAYLEDPQREGLTLYHGDDAQARATEAARAERDG